ncbi:MAG: hypothetical protein TREMPRED_001358 [Tremellales sp. Tagirdzhanova-0007]|nr:MAG: hypothetical protein TREMPRED_001358 [Tremellales sp. Tagirdzhanova-0007]
MAANNYYNQGVAAPAYAPTGPNVYDQQRVNNAYYANQNDATPRQDGAPVWQGQAQAQGQPVGQAQWNGQANSAPYDFTKQSQPVH